jgi:hypothetical protein
MAKMQCSSSNRALASASLPALLLLAAALPACALGLDFDALSRECSPPRFDLPGSDEYCGAELVARAPYLPPGQAVDGGFTLFPLVATSGRYLATASVAFTEDGEGCTAVSPGIAVARLEDDGRLTSLGGLLGRDVGLSFGLGGCPNGLRNVWPVELHIFDTVPLVHAAASFAEAGVLEVWVDPGRTEVAFYHHMGGDTRWPVQRECLLGACVTPVGQLCLRHADCAPHAYCGDGRCQTLPDCTFDVHCATVSPDLRCAQRRRRCTVECTSDRDCPHTHPCIAGLCGGEGCALALGLACLSADAECVGGVCLAPCSTDDACRTAGHVCYSPGAGTGVCSMFPGGTFGACTSDADCAFGTAGGFAPVPPNSALTLNLPGLLMSAGNNLRLGVFVPLHVPPYFAPPVPGTALGAGTFSDVLYAEPTGAVYVAVSNGFIVRFDWDAMTQLSPGAAAHSRTFPVALEPGARVHALRRAGSLLVTLERVPGALGEATAIHARAYHLDANPAADLAPAFAGTLPLGDALQASFGTLPGNPDVWVFGLDRSRGGELLFFDLRDPATPTLLGRLVTADETTAEVHFVNVAEAGIFVTSSAGITPWVLSSGGAR